MYMIIPQLDEQGLLQGRTDTGNTDQFTFELRRKNQLRVLKLSRVRF